MNINLHIDRLVLDGVPLAPNQRPALQTAVEAELTRLLASDGWQDTMLSGESLYRVPTAGIEVAHDASPVQLGAQIAGAVYWGIGK